MCFYFSLIFLYKCFYQNRKTWFDDACGNQVFLYFSWYLLIEKKKKSAHAFHWLLRIHFCFIRVFIHKSGELRNTRKGQEQLFSSLTLTPAHRHWEISRLPTTESSPVQPVSVRIEPNTFGLETHLPNQWATCPQWKHMCKISEKNKPNLSTK